ncbi:MAG: hypothetical protein MR411_01915 [Tenericutes bacterium]|nr:hypothetical protein [Mycoplasmatota bacterium]
MNYLNSLILVGKFNSLIKINDNISCLNIFQHHEDGDVIIPIIIFDKCAEHLKKSCESGDLIGIKGHINIDDSGLIIVTDKITFMYTKRDE